MVAIADTAFGECAPIGFVVPHNEQATGGAVLGDAVALQVGDMDGERCRTRVVPDNTCLDGHEPGLGIQSTGGA